MKSRCMDWGGRGAFTSSLKFLMYEMKLSRNCFSLSGQKFEVATHLRSWHVFVKQERRGLVPVQKTNPEQISRSRPQHTDSSAWLENLPGDTLLIASMA